MKNKNNERLFGRSNFLEVLAQEDRWWSVFLHVACALADALLEGILPRVLQKPTTRLLSEIALLATHFTMKHFGPNQRLLAVCSASCVSLEITWQRHFVILHDLDLIATRWVIEQSNSCVHASQS